MFTLFIKYDFEIVIFNPLSMYVCIIHLGIINGFYIILIILPKNMYITHLFTCNINLIRTLQFLCTLANKIILLFRISIHYVAFCSYLI